MIADESISNDHADDIDLVAIWQVLWSNRVLVASFTIAAGLVAVALAITSPPFYRADVIVTQSNQEGGLGVTGTLAGQLSGLANLAGVNLSGAQGSEREAVAVLKSNHLIEEFINRNELLPILLRNSDKPPTLWRGVKQFREGVLNIREDTRQGTIDVAIEWTEPMVAARWANGFVALANELIRRRALEDSTHNIAYLKDQVAHTDDIGLRRVLYDLIENETKTVMLANGQTDYAFTVVDPAVAPEIKAGPHRAVMTLIGLTVGFFIGAFIAFLRRTFSRSKDR